MTSPDLVPVDRELLTEIARVLRSITATDEEDDDGAGYSETRSDLAEQIDYALTVTQSGSLSTRTSNEDVRSSRPTWAFRPVGEGC